MLSYALALLASAVGTLISCGLNETTRFPFRFTTIKRHFCHVYTPVEGRFHSNTLVVFIHGGGWHAGAIDPGRGTVSYDTVGRALSSRGYSVALVSYPKCQSSTTVAACVYALITLASILACVLLCTLGVHRVLCCAVCAILCAVACSMVRARVLGGSHSTPGTSARLQIDAVGEALDALAEKFPGMPMLLVGHSAGGHLACMHVFEAAQRGDAARTARICGIVCASGVFDVSGMYNAAPWPLSFALREIFVRAPFPCRDDETRLSPHASVRACTGHTRHIKWHIASAFLDMPSLVGQADAFHARLLAHGHASTRTYNIGFGHGLGMVYSFGLWEIVEEFINGCETPRSFGRAKQAVRTPI